MKQVFFLLFQLKELLSIQNKSQTETFEVFSPQAPKADQIRAISGFIIDPKIGFNFYFFFII